MCRWEDENQEQRSKNQDGAPYAFSFVLDAFTFMLPPETDKFCNFGFLILNFKHADYS